MNHWVDSKLTINFGQQIQLIMTSLHVFVNKIWLMICTFFTSLNTTILPFCTHDSRAALKQGWIVRVILWRASGWLIALTTKLLILEWASPSIAARLVVPISFEEGHPGEKVGSWSTNLMAIGE